MIGLILCGGKSSRMGTDKGLLYASGITWAETAHYKLSPYVSSTVISVNREQLPSYKEHFSENQLIVDTDTLDIGGPLCGLLSAHLLFPEEDIFLFACDLLLMEPFVFETLLDLKKELPNYEAYVFINEKEPEPLCSIFTSNALKMVLTTYQEGGLGRQSMKHILEIVNTLKTEIPKGWQYYFKNVNSHQDLNQ